MICIEKYELLPHPYSKNKYHVISQEKNNCPVCGNKSLKVLGSRNRTMRNNYGEKLILIIRRLKCSLCRRIHHELPDLLVPYKRYSSETIELIIEDKEDCVPCEESSIFRVKQWFRKSCTYIAGCLDSIVVRQGLEVLRSQLSAYRRIRTYVGNANRWLARVVRTLTNSNLWVHTRSAFLS